HTRWPRDWRSDVCSSDLAFPVRSFCLKLWQPLAEELRAPGTHLCKQHQLTALADTLARTVGLIRNRLSICCALVLCHFTRHRLKIGRASCAERVSILERT